MTLQDEIKTWRDDMSNAGLYYFAPAAASQLDYAVTFPEGNDNPDCWVMIQGIKWGMSKLDEMNMKIIIVSLREIEDPTQLISVQGEYAVRVLSETGEVTEAGKRLQGFVESLQDYPVLDDIAYSQFEYDNQCEIIRDTATNTKDDLPDDWDEQVRRWLWDNCLEALDFATSENWIGSEAIARAIIALGFDEPKGEV